jgi:hypothetical protein
MIIEPTGSNSTVTGAIRQAARMTGADFRYLLATAQVESNLNPGAQAPSSSAKGLFQFIDQTWLATLKEQGAALGYAPYSNAIGRTPTGEYAIANPRMANAVMNLRNDPTANALMAGAFTNANAGKLAARLGRSPTEGELYIAHFLGPTGAGKLISMADATPQTPAAAVFPSAASANRRIFFDSRGQPRSIGDVYRTLVGRYEVARGAPPSTPTMATAPDAQARNGFAPDTALMTEAYANAARMSPAGQSDGSGSVFNGLFRTAGENEPIAPVVSALWGTQAPPSPPQKPRPLPEPAPASAAPATEAVSGPLDLFQDKLPNVSALFRGRV